MKRRIFSIVMAALLLTSVLSMTACGLPSMIKMMSAKHSFGYSRCFVYLSDSDFAAILNFVYEETTLHLYDDGTWTIDMDDPSILIDGVIDKGTYTVENGEYTFEGFEYGMKTVGKMTNNGFNIFFKNPVDLSSNAAILYFTKK